MAVGTFNCRNISVFEYLL